MSSMLACLLSTLAAAPLPDGWQTRPLTDEDLIEFSSEELRQLRNEIYARHGYVFKSADLAEYFRQQPWYKPKPAFNPAGAGAVSPTEKANVELIKRIEDGRREYEVRDDTSQVFIWRDPVALEAKGKLATIKDDGSLEASPYELSVKLSCRFDVKTPTSKKCGCGHRLDVYDHRLRIRTASKSKELPPAYVLEQIPGGHCSETLHFRPGRAGTGPGLLDLGDSAGRLLEIRYYTSDDRSNFVKRRRYFALDNDRTIREVADIEEGVSQVRYGKTFREDGTYFQATSHTDVDTPPATPPTLRLTTHIDTVDVTRPPSRESTDKRTSRQEVRMLPWSANEKRFKESAN